MRPQFTRDQISQLDLEEDHVQKAMVALPVDGVTGWTPDTDIQTIFFRLTIDSATEFLFGESVESQMAAVNGSSKDQFAYYFDKSQWYSAHRGRLEKLYFLANNKESRHSNEQVHAFVDHFVQNALDIVQNEKRNGIVDEEKSGPYVFLHALANTTQDPIELRSQLLNILLAGRDTTASLLSWTVLLLAPPPPPPSTSSAAPSSTTSAPTKPLNPSPSPALNPANPSNTASTNPSASSPSSP